MTARLIALLLALPAAPVLAAKPALLPPLVLSTATPTIAATIAGQPVMLRVDPGADPWIALTPAAVARLGLGGDARPDDAVPARGEIAIQIGQTRIDLPTSRETVGYAGFSVKMRVVAAPTLDAGGADGVVAPALLPHAEVRLVARPATPADRTTVLKAETRGLFFADTLQADWPLPAGKLELEFHPFRAVSIASVAAADRLVRSSGGRLTGAVHRVEVAYGVTRPVRTLTLDRPASIAGVPVTTMDVRLYDWQGGAELPPDADADGALTVTGKRGRQRGWPILKLGRDVLGRCAEIVWRRARSEIALTCPAAGLAP